MTIAIDMRRAELDRRDRDARDLARREFTKPVVLVAGAGTGKTTTLVARIAVWLLGPGWERARADIEQKGDTPRIAARAIDGVLAITFTEAAASDMDRKLRTALAACEQGLDFIGLEREYVPDRTLAAERARALRLALDRPLATTIHAFCRGLIAEHPIEAGVSPQFDVDPDLERVLELAREAIEDDLRRSSENDEQSEWLALARAGHGPSDVEEALRAMLQKGFSSAALGEESFSAARIEIELAHLRAGVDAFLGRFASRLGAVKKSPVTLEALQELRQLALELADHNRTPRQRLDAARALSDGRAAERLDQWCGRKGFIPSEKEQIGEALPEAESMARALRAPFVALARTDPDLERGARVLLRRLLARLADMRKYRGILTFNDLLQHAHDLVTRDARVKARMRSRLRQVLVDEFQDTDREQCDIVRALALEPHGLGTPGLFIVGDPKQSIYGWRGADLSAYESFVDEVRAAGGIVAMLARNFRSTQRVLDAVERFVEPVMIAEPGVQPAFEPLIQAREITGPVPELWVTWNRDAALGGTLGETSAPSAMRLEAQWLAAELHRAPARGVAWRTIGVLARTRTGFDVLLEALREAGVPYDVPGDRSYYRRREIIDAAALFATVADPADALSFLAWLRASAIGLPDAALACLWPRGLHDIASRIGSSDDATSDVGPLAEIEVLARTAEKDLAARTFGGRSVGVFTDSLLLGLETLGTLRRTLRGADPAEFVERARELVLFEATEAARHLGRHRLANLQRFFARVAAELDSSGGDATALNRALRRALAREREEPEGRPPQTGEDAVRVMTVHGAKGLEFSEVFIVGAHRDSRRNTTESFAFSRDAREHVLFGAATPGWWRHADEARRRASAETARLLYVALTRAEKRLVVSANWPLAAKKSTTFQGLMESAAPLGFDARLSAAAVAGEDRFEIDDLVVSFPPSASSTTTAHASAAPASIDRARVVRDARTIAARRAAAERRIARPRIGSASGSAHVERDSTADDALPRERARLVGTVLHRALEEFDLGKCDPASRAEEVARVRAMLPQFAAAGTESADSDDARACIRAFEAFTGSMLLERFFAIGPTILARELALVVAANENDEPLDAISGAADLVYRDPENGRVVVADFKTEHVAPGDDPRARAEAHTRQLVCYARALQTALVLTLMPRMEVWFVTAGIVVEIAT